MSMQRFTNAVRAHLVAHFASSRTSGHDPASPPPLHSYGPEDIVAFVDFQNLHYFLKESCRVPASQVHMPNLLHEFGEMHSLPITQMIFVTGIHDPRREPIRYQAMAKRVRWLRFCGARVITIPLVYMNKPESGLVAVEKGVDVRLACELMKAVFGGLRRGIVVSQDIDLGQSILTAKDVAQQMGRSFTAFSPRLDGATWDRSARSGLHGLHGSTTLPFPVELARKHCRPEVNVDE
ncbi:MAG: hypothetical protein O9327_14960 [Polaromonas sp.]|jgi:uncharacterized LabA/DUF88 family protein|nr:hypothetical protein [Polaromonas sp.]